MGRAFETTQWSLVMTAAGSSPAAREALGNLFQIYWYPLYAFVRRGGHGAEPARDLTQSFLLHLLESGYLGRADPDAGKFRSFLLASLKHFLSNQRQREEALKRRADHPDHRITLDGAEDRYATEAGADGDPELLYERQWAMTLMGHAFERLSEYYANRGQSAQYERLKGFLTGDDAGKPYAAAARELSMGEGAVKVAVHRMRGRLGALLRAEVARTVRHENDVDAELRHLLTVLPAGSM